MGYDDPLEVTTVDTSVVVAPGQAQPVTKLYPIYDEAAGGTLQVVLNKTGEVVARSVNNDPFGGAEFDLAGAAIDHVEVQATKNAQGTLDSVAVTMRATEQLTTASLTTGTRLAVVDANGTVVRTSTAQPTLSSDAFTVKWTLPAAEWAALSDPATVGGRTPASLSIAATNTLRAALWKFDLPILPAPDWATASKSIFTSTTLPVEVRESLATIASTISGINAGEAKTAISYDVPNLSLVGTGGNADVENLLSATFQAQPFAEPFTRKFYVRERWYDPRTGTWLSPDPIGYQDSANLYAYAAGDPVNGRDPTGEDSYDDKLQAYTAWYGSQVDAISQKRKGLSEQIRRQRAVTSDTGLLEAEDNILTTQMMTFGGTPDNAALYIDYARANGRADVLSMSLEQIHAGVVADEGVRNVGAAVVGAFGPHLAQTEGINFSGAWRRTKQFVSDAIDAYNESIFSSEVGAVGPSVRNRPRVASLKPLKPVVLGETMDTRVEPVAETLNGHTFQPRSKSTDPNVWKYNQRRWIRSQIQSGRQIFDIDIDPSRSVRSDYYAIEMEELQKVRHRVYFGKVSAQVRTKTGATTQMFDVYQWVP